MVGRKESCLASRCLGILPCRNNLSAEACKVNSSKWHEDRAQEGAWLSQVPCLCRSPSWRECGMARKIRVTRWRLCLGAVTEVVSGWAAQGQWGTFIALDIICAKAVGSQGVLNAATGSESVLKASV